MNAQWGGLNKNPILFHFFLEWREGLVETEEIWGYASFLARVRRFIV